MNYIHNCINNRSLRNSHYGSFTITTMSCSDNVFFNRWSVLIENWWHWRSYWLWKKILTIYLPFTRCGSLYIYSSELSLLPSIYISKLKIIVFLIIKRVLTYYPAKVDTSPKMVVNRQLCLSLSIVMRVQNGNLIHN